LMPFVGGSRTRRQLKMNQGKKGNISTGLRCSVGKKTKKADAAEKKEEERKAIAPSDWNRILSRCTPSGIGRERRKFDW